ncbi:hypothetical protein [Hamadaea tsunoensis]|nr:hypothetical protein [Hamadaea tsunoensis]
MSDSLRERVRDAVGRRSGTISVIEYRYYGTAVAIPLIEYR